MSSPPPSGQPLAEELAMQRYIVHEKRGDGGYEDGVLFLCQVITRINSRGIWYGDDPFAFSVPLLMMQLSLISVFSRSIHHILKPLGQPSIVSQILAGVVLGPSVLGRNSGFAFNVFPSKGRGVFETFALFGLMLFVFQIGVKVDPSILVKSGKRTLLIGTLGFFVPYMMASFTAFMLGQFLSLEQDVSKVLDLLVALLSMSAFPVIACFLEELKILNSEIGRLASSSSLVCDICHWSIVVGKYVGRLAMTKSLKTSFGSLLSMSLLISFIVFGIRPAALWTVRHTPEGKPVKEIYIFAVIVALFACVLIGEAIGLSAFAASFLFGLVIPDGPPLGVAVVERLDCFVSVMLMPIFFATSGLQMDVFAIQSFQNVMVILVIVLVTVLGKFIGAMLPLLILRMPLRDAVSLGLILNSKGIIELSLLNSWRTAKVLNEECFAIMIISVVVVTGIISPVVKLLYDPSRRFVAYKRRTILHNGQGDGLNILACIHCEDDIQATLKLLDASNPTKKSPVNVCVLHLVKLVGRASSLLVAVLPRETSLHNLTVSDRIFDAFGKFEQKIPGLITVQCYKGVSPYATMHNDVCSLALEKRITLIIIPFHKQYAPWGRVETSYTFRQLNKNVLEKAPCSVGVLIDYSKRKKHYRSVHVESPNYRVAVLFFWGADDREALAYARRMSEHPNVILTVIRFSTPEEPVGRTARSKMLDVEILNEFKGKAQTNERTTYLEDVVVNAACVVDVFRSLENAYDLVMVGRRHGESELMRDLGICCENEGLGVVGDALATMCFECGSLILVIQQQTKVWGLRDPEESSRLRRVKL